VALSPTTDPYAPGAGTTPAVMAGRRTERVMFERLLDRLEAGRSSSGLILSGPRGFGKTILLNEFQQTARSRGWFTAFEEVRPGVSFAKVLAVLSHRVLMEMSTKKRMAARVRRALGVLKAFTRVSALGVKLEIDVDAVLGTADSGLLELDLSALFVELGEVARDGAPASSWD
jgi:AAA+ ATPase superfamily predicted ATPase